MNVWNTASLLLWGVSQSNNHISHCTFKIYISDNVLNIHIYGIKLFKLVKCVKLKVFVLVFIWPRHALFIFIHHWDYIKHTWDVFSEEDCINMKLVTSANSSNNSASNMVYIACFNCSDWAQIDTSSHNRRNGILWNCLHLSLCLFIHLSISMLTYAITQPSLGWFTLNQRLLRLFLPVCVCNIIVICQPGTSHSFGLQMLIKFLFCSDNALCFLCSDFSKWQWPWKMPSKILPA